jgi:hypothetical protein
VLVAGGVSAAASARARVGGSACEASAWLSHSSVRCRVPRGAGATLSLVVTAARALGSVTEAAWYVGPAPALLGASPPPPPPLVLSGHAASLTPY